MTGMFAQLRVINNLWCYLHHHQPHKHYLVVCFLDCVYQKWSYLLYRLFAVIYHYLVNLLAMVSHTVRIFRASIYFKHVSSREFWNRLFEGFCNPSAIEFNCSIIGCNVIIIFFASPSNVLNILFSCINVFALINHFPNGKINFSNASLISFLTNKIDFCSKVLRHQSRHMVNAQFDYQWFYWKNVLFSVKKW